MNQLKRPKINLRAAQCQLAFFGRKWNNAFKIYGLGFQLNVFQTMLGQNTAFAWRPAGKNLARARVYAIFLRPVRNVFVSIGA